MQTPKKPLFRERTHNHDTCVVDAIAQADRICRERGLRFTPLRRQVLKIVWDRHAPTGAYDILDALRVGKRGAAPPTVYRALEFLREHGFVHKIESLNSFVGCNQPSGKHMGQFLICSKCSQVGELDDPEIEIIIQKKAAVAGFSVTRPTIEILGLCPDCAETTGA